MAKSQAVEDINTVFRPGRGPDGPWRLVSVKRESHEKVDGEKRHKGSLITARFQRCHMPKSEDIVAVLNGEEDTRGNPKRYTKGIKLPTVDVPFFRYDASDSIPEAFMYKHLIREHSCKIPGADFLALWDAAGWNRQTGALGDPSGFKRLATVNGKLPKLPDGKIDNSKTAKDEESLLYFTLMFSDNKDDYRAKIVPTGFTHLAPEADFSAIDFESETSPEDEATEDTKPQSEDIEVPEEFTQSKEKENKKEIADKPKDKKPSKKKEKPLGENKKAKGTKGKGK